MGSSKKIRVAPIPMDSHHFLKLSYENCHVELKKTPTFSPSHFPIFPQLWPLSPAQPPATPQASPLSGALLVDGVHRLQPLHRCVGQGAERRAPDQVLHEDHHVDHLRLDTAIRAPKPGGWNSLGLNGQVGIPNIPRIPVVENDLRQDYWWSCFRVVHDVWLQGRDPWLDSTTQAARRRMGRHKQSRPASWSHRPPAPSKSPWVSSSEMLYNSSVFISFYKFSISNPRKSE